MKIVKCHKVSWFCWQCPSCNADNFCEDDPTEIVFLTCPNCDEKFIPVEG